MSLSLMRILAVSAVCAVILAGCGPAEEPPVTVDPPPVEEPTPDPPPRPVERPPVGIQVKVGAVLPLTGQGSEYAEQARKGIALAAEETRTEGTVVPEIVWADNQGLPEETTAAVDGLIDSDQVHAVIGAISTENSITAGDRAQADGIPMVAPGVSAMGLTRGRDYVFRAGFTDTFQGAAAADFVYDTLGHRRAAVLVSTTDADSMPLGDAFSQAFRRRGGQIVSQMAFSADTDDFSGQLTQLRLIAPDVIFMPAGYEQAARCVWQARDSGLRSAFMGTAGWDSPKLFTLSEGAVEGSHFTTHFSAEEDRAVVNRFVQSYSAMYDESPGAIAALSYDAAMLIFDAAKRAGATDSTALRDALATTSDFEGVTGTLSMDENRNPVKPLVVMKAQEGSATLVETISP